MAERNKCNNCGYVFDNNDGSVCPQFFTSSFDGEENIIDCYNPPQTSISKHSKKNYAKPYVNPSKEKNKNALIAYVVITGIATLIGLLFSIFNGI